jgi:hypothetical protein
MRYWRVLATRRGSRGPGEPRGSSAAVLLGGHRQNSSPPLVGNSWFLRHPSDFAGLLRYLVVPPVAAKARSRLTSTSERSSAGAPVCAGSAAVGGPAVASMPSSVGPPRRPLPRPARWGARRARDSARRRQGHGRSGRRHTLNPRERRTDERNREQPNIDPGRASAPRRRLRRSRPAAHSRGPVRTRAAPSGWEHDQVDLEVLLKDTDGPDQKVPLQAWLTGRAHLVATSHEPDFDHALAEVRRDLIRQIEDERSRREPRKRRKTRCRTT